MTPVDSTPAGSSSSSAASAGTPRASGFDRLLDAGEVSVLLNVPLRWVREATRSGRLPCVELGRYRRYDRADVLAWVEDQKVGGASMRYRKHVPEVPGGGTK